MKKYFSDVGESLIWWFAQGVALGGLAVIGNEFLAKANVIRMFSDGFLDTLGAVLAPLALLLVSISVYFEKRDRTAPTEMTRKFTSPFMIGLSLLFLVCLVVTGELSSRYVDGLSAIALGGAMMRLTGMPKAIMARADVADR